MSHSEAVATNPSGAAAFTQRAEQTLLKSDIDWLRFLEDGPAFVAITHGPQHEVVFANAAFRRILGPRRLLGLASSQALPELAPAGLVEHLEEVYRSGEAQTFLKKKLPLVDPVTGEAADRYFSFVYQPVFTRSDSLFGIICKGFEVTGQIEAEQRQAFLLRELEHRVKNTVSTALSIAAQTCRTSRNIEEFTERFGERLLSFSKTTEALVRSGFEGVRLPAIIEEILSPFPLRRFQLSGPVVMLPPREAAVFGVAINELATNAAKFGALANETGAVGVDWRTESSEGGAPYLFLTWRETNGPAVTPPTRRGFGTELLERIGGRGGPGAPVLQFLPTGLECRLGFPLKPGG